MLTNESTLRIILADDDEDDRTFFSEAIAELKMTNQLTLFNDGKDLMEYMHNPDAVAAHPFPGFKHAVQKWFGLPQGNPCRSAF
jgi:hypothetical protein